MAESDSPQSAAPPGPSRPNSQAEGAGPAGASQDDPGSTGTSRLQLLWDVLIFQFKLAADGLRDVLLSPISIVSAVIGLITGGDEPDRYFKQVLRLGRRSEIWINLFGYRKHAGTADELISPLKEKVFSEARNHPLVSKVGGEFNRTLDSVNATVASKAAGKSDQKPGAD